MNFQVDGRPLDNPQHSACNNQARVVVVGVFKRDRGQYPCRPTSTTIFLFREAEDGEGEEHGATTRRRILVAEINSNGTATETAIDKEV